LSLAQCYLFSRLISLMLAISCEDTHWQFVPFHLSVEDCGFLSLTLLIG
jgi:hypothetical protein